MPVREEAVRQLKLVVQELILRFIILRARVLLCVHEVILYVKVCIVFIRVANVLWVRKGRLSNRGCVRNKNTVGSE